MHRWSRLALTTLVVLLAPLAAGGPAAGAIIGRRAATRRRPRHGRVLGGPGRVAVDGQRDPCAR